MGLLTFALNTTLTGCIDHRAGIADEALHDYFTALMDAAGAMLFGRNTYELMEGAWPQVARVMRGEVKRVKQLEFVDAARCLGISERTILFGEIIPNALAPVMAVGTLIVAQAILLEASLSFLGLSSPDLVSWGRMLNSGQRFLFNGWWLSFFPGTAIFVTVLAFNVLGDAVNDLLNPRRKR